ncbi:MAG: polyprenyl synthetase family protein [Pseudomonadota bacterium]
MSVSVATSSQIGAPGQSEAGFQQAVAEMRTLLADDLQAVNAEILARMDSGVSLIPDLAGHLVNAGGKRVRPMLTLAAARAFDYAGDHHIKLAAAVELIHGATLLHDDVVDGSALRRGLETANIIWGNKESVLVGDYIFSRAFELMVAAKNLEVLRVLSRASGVIAEGEVLQLTTQKNVETTFETYLAVVEAKTAALFAGASHAGALIAGADEREVDALKDYGRFLGIAYQLIDDALDYAGFEANLGKSVGDDFREGKMTLPVVYAIERAKPEEKPFWRRVITDGRQEDGDFEQAASLMARDNAVVDTVACARRYADCALAELLKAPENEYTAALADLVTTSVMRFS